MQIRTSVYLLKGVVKKTHLTDYDDEDRLRIESPPRSPSRGGATTRRKKRKGRVTYSTKLTKNKHVKQLTGTGKENKDVGLEQIFLSRDDIVNLANMAEYGLRNLGLSYKARNSLGTGMEKEMGILG